MAFSLSLLSSVAVTTGTSVDGGTGSTRLMVYFGATNSGSDSVTAVSWNSEAFTKSGSIQSGAARFVTLWYLKPSGTGTHSLTITGGETGSELSVYTNVVLGSSPKNFNSTNGSGTTAALSITANNGDWLVGGAISNVGSVTAGTATTIRSAASSIVAADSNAAASPTALNFAFPSGSYAAVGLALVSIVNTTTTVTNGSYTLTGFTMLFIYGRKVVLAAGSYILTGFTAAFSQFQKWIDTVKHSSTFTNTSKH